MRTIKSAACIIASLLIISVFISEADAVPIFARKYRTSCMTCHNAFPKLNPFGGAFRRNGYKIHDADERYIKEKPISMGAPAWKEVWPEGLWPSDLPATLPLSLIGNSLYRYDSNSRARHDFVFPEEVELFSAGTIGDDISFLGSIALIEEGNEFGGVERLFLRFNDLFADNLLNLTVGQFEPSVSPFSNHRRLTHSAYLMNTFEVGRNNFKFSDQRGIEANGIAGGRFEYALGLVNGNGTGKMEESTGSLDNNSTKDVYVRGGYKMGGMGLDNSGISIDGEDLPSIVESGKSIYIGALGYSGENRLSGAGTYLDDRFYRYGLVFDLIYEDVNLFGAVVRGKNDNPHGDLREVSVNSYFSEVDVTLYPWLIGVLRYGVAEADYEPKKDEIIIGIVALIRANIKVIIEVAAHSTGGESDIGLIRLDFAI